MSRILWGIFILISFQTYGRHLALLFTYNHHAVQYHLLAVNQLDRAISQGISFNETLFRKNPLMRQWASGQSYGKENHSISHAQIWGFILSFLSIPGWISFAIVYFTSKNPDFKKDLAKGFLIGLGIFMVLGVFLMPVILDFAHNQAQGCLSHALVFSYY